MFICRINESVIYFLQYLEENVDKKFLDVTVMTRQLMERYPEYTRRKQAPFRALVEQGELNTYVFRKIYVQVLKKYFC